MDELRERELIRAAKQNLQAFDELYRFYVPRVFGYAMNRLHNREMAEDATAQTFAKVLSALHTFDESRGVRFSSWLFRIATNVIIDQVRRKREFATDPDEMPEVASREDASAHAEHTILSEELRQAMNKLPDHQQTILALKFFEELSNDEIAEILNVRTGTVAVRVHRALRALRTLLPPHLAPAFARLA